MTIVVQSGVLRGSSAVLQLKLDASDSGSVTASSTLVSQWNDLSGNGRHFTQATGANKPIYPGATQNSLNTMRFGDASAITFLDNTSIAINQRFLVFWVIFNTGGVGSILFDDTAGTSRVIAGSQDGSDQYSIYAGSSSIFTTSSPANSIWKVICGDYNGASSKIYVNGVQEATGDIGSNNMATMRLGSRYDGTTLPFIGLLGELRIYTSPGASTIADKTTELMSKWAIS